MNDTVFQKAKELAAAIAGSSEYREMRSMDEESLRDQVLSGLYSEYTQKRALVEELSTRDEPDYNEMGAAARELEELQSRIQAIPQMQKLTQARQAFTEMMRKVNQELQRVLSPEQGCVSGCDSCKGCDSHGAESQ